MALSKTYFEIAELIDTLPEDELRVLLTLVKNRIDAIEYMANYDPEKDPMLTGEDLFEGPGDLSERVEEILFGDEKSTQEDKYAS